MITIRRPLLAVAAGAVALGAPLSGAAWAGTVALKANPVDEDGRVTLGEIFDGAGAAADVVVAQRVGPSVVLQAGELQAQARQAGLTWDNPSGLRRVAVRQATSAARPARSQDQSPATATRAAFASAPAGQPVIARNDIVRVTYQVGGVNLSVMGKAMRSAAVGEPVAVLNTSSNRIIDAVASGPGQAVAGPAAATVRANPQQFAAR